MIRFLFHRLLLALLIVTLLVPAFAAGKGDRRQGGTGEKVSERGRIDYEQGVLYATGLGALSNKEPNQAKAYLRARAFAKLDALRNLLMTVDHVRIDSQTTGRDFEAVSDEIRAEIRGIVRGAQIVAERKVPVGNGVMVEVTVATPLYGDRGIARVFLPELIRRNQEAEESRDADIPSPAPQGPEDDPVVRLPEPPPVPRVVAPRREDALSRRDLGPRPTAARYTSLIVDARGLGVERCMSPKIRRPDGREVWGTVRVNLDWLIEHGIVVYGLTMADARQHPRAGDNPLIVRAVGRAGGRFNSDAVVSDEDAERILAANAHSGFLDRYRVIFVVDPRR